MLYKTRIIAQRRDPELEDLGVKKDVTEYYSTQFEVEDIRMHHSFEHETDEGEFMEGSILFFYDGSAISVLEPFEKIAEAREVCNAENAQNPRN